jgi:hypothetical protein
MSIAKREALKASLFLLLSSGNILLYFYEASVWIDATVFILFMSYCVFLLLTTKKTGSVHLSEGNQQDGKHQ